MGDLKTNWSDPGTPIPDLGGQGVISRGSDPLIDMSGSSGLKTLFDKPIDPSLDGAETPNSVSGLPLLPNRFEPAQSGVTIPSMKDRSPLTVDKP